MILVNVSRTAGPRATAAQLLASAKGDWPLRAGATREDLDRQVGQPVVAIARNTIIGVYNLNGLLALDSGRVEFDLEQADSRFIGLAAPTGLRYVRGEAWPVKIVDTAESLRLLNQAADSSARTTAASPTVKTMRVGAFTVTVDPANPTLLRVTAPRGYAVLVAGAP